MPAPISVTFSYKSATLQVILWRRNVPFSTLSLTFMAHKLPGLLLYSTCIELLMYLLQVALYHLGVHPLVLSSSVHLNITFALYFTLIASKLYESCFFCVIRSCISSVRPCKIFSKLSKLVFGGTNTLWYWFIAGAPVASRGLSADRLARTGVGKAR